MIIRFFRSFIIDRLSAFKMKRYRSKVIVGGAVTLIDNLLQIGKIDRLLNADFMGSPVIDFEPVGIRFGQKRFGQPDNTPFAVNFLFLVIEQPEPDRPGFDALLGL